MKESIFKFRFVAFLLAFIFTATLFAQQATIYNNRTNDKNGVNVFEAPKETETKFEGIKVRIGGDFAQQFQALDHTNGATENMYTHSDGKDYNLNALFPLGNGFNLATANLNLDIALEDGIMVKLENYMSSRHHSEFWVKGGYIQIDKLPFWENTKWFDDMIRVKVGHMEINYGDQHFRRSDNGGAIHNPFVGNYIMDAFATEIGGEVYLFPAKNVMAMVGMSSGLIKGDISPGEKAPSIYAKLAYDAQVNDDLRFRLSGSIYNNGNTPRNTLYSGDRSGSRFYMVMEPEYAVGRSGFAASSTSSNFTSARYNPGFSNEITAVAISPFLKYKGLEFFGTFETTSGKTSREDDRRTFNQVGGELLYRFFDDESVYLGGRYNAITGEASGISEDVKIDRIELVAGWFVTKNILAKVEYVKQTYSDWPTDNLFYEGEFDGIMVEAVIGF